MAKEFVDTTAETVEETEAVPVSELITVKQLPIIEQRLEALRDEIIAFVAEALALPVTDETIKEVKKKRADLNKKRKELEGLRNDVKKKVVEPFNAFDKIFRRCVTDIFQDTDDQLKEKIEAVEKKRKAEKEANVRAYFAEYAESLNLPDFITYERMGLDIILSITETKYKKQVKAFLDRAASDLQLIESQQDSDEILVEYQKTLDASRAILEVNNRHKLIEAERQRAEERRRQLEEQEKAEEQVRAAYEEELAAQPPTEAPVAVIKEVSEEELEAEHKPQLYRGDFTLIATKADITDIMNYAKKKGASIKYHGKFKKCSGPTEA